MSHSPDSSQKETLGDCCICEQPAHGVHFGVLSCRACAAFFRRTVVCNRQYPCRRGDDKCQIQKGTRMICRKCRYNKCARLGMTPDNVQWNRDRLSASKPSSSSTVNKSPPAASAREGKPQIQSEVDPIPRNACQNQSWAKQIDDAVHCHIYQRLEHVFNTFNPELEFPGIWEQTPLVRMQMALARYRQEQAMDPNNIALLDEFNIYSFRNSCERTMFQVAEWHMFCREFALLPMKDKFTIFKESWKAFMRLEKLEISIELFGSRVISDKIFVIFDNCAISYNTTSIDLSSVSDYDSAYVRRFFDPIVDSALERIVAPLLAMNMTPIELTYMLCQLSFHVEGMDLPYEAMDAMVDFRDKISDDIHNYYVSIGLENYAQRLIRVMSIIQAIEGVQSRKEQMLELIRIFDIIKIDVHDGHTLC